MQGYELRCPVCGTRSKKKIKANEEEIRCSCGYVYKKKVENEGGFKVY